MIMVCAANLLVGIAESVLLNGTLFPDTYPDRGAQHSSWAKWTLQLRRFWPSCGTIAGRLSWTIELKQRCCLCYQWISSPNGMKAHIRKAHSSTLLAHEAKIQVSMLSWRPVMISSCRICEAVVKDCRQHAGSCVPLFQLLLMSAEDALKQERTLFGHLLPSYSASAAPTSKGESPAANREPKRQRTRTDEEADAQEPGQAQAQGQKARTGQGEARQRGLRHFFRPGGSQTHGLSDAAECQACRIQLDTGFLLTLRNTEAPECVLPVMFRVSAAWRRAKEADPTSLHRPLRCSLLISLILELVARLERLQSDEALQKQAQELEWLTPDLSGSAEFGIRQQVGARGAGGGHLARTVGAGGCARALGASAEARSRSFQLDEVPSDSAIGRGHDRQSCGVPFLDVGLRGRAAPLHKILTTLVDCECLSLIAARLRPQRLRRLPAADRLSKWLSSV